MRQVTVAVTQMACGADREANIARAEGLVRAAAAQGANVVLLQELFQTPYFCKDQDLRHFELACAEGEDAGLARMRALAAELGVVLPVSFFERADKSHFNTVVVYDADGSRLGHYRKTHIPGAPGYQEKYYFTPGDTGFTTFPTRYGRIGVGVCWDQWFPECARALALAGAELLLFPTAIGSEPEAPALDSAGHWRRVMQGHAAANMVPVAASNRIGAERGSSCELRFYGSSFIADHTGAIVAEANRTDETVVCARFDLDAIARARLDWGLFRDRRPECYSSLLGH